MVGVTLGEDVVLLLTELVDGYGAGVPATKMPRKTPDTLRLHFPTVVLR